MIANQHDKIGTMFGLYVYRYLVAVVAGKPNPAEAVVFAVVLVVPNANPVLGAALEAVGRDNPPKLDAVVVAADAAPSFKPPPSVKPVVIITKVLDNI